VLGALVGAGVLLVPGGQAAAAPRLDDGKNYWITNVDTGRLLDNANQSLDPENPIIQWPRHYRENQQWFFEREDAPDVYRIRNRHSGLCLKARTYVEVIYRYDPQTGQHLPPERYVYPTGAVVQSQCRDNIEGSTSGTYRWHLRDAGNGSYEIQPTGLTGSSGHRLASQNHNDGSEVRIVDAASSLKRWWITSVRLPYSFELAVNVGPFRRQNEAVRCNDGWQLETLPGNVYKVRFDDITEDDWVEVHWWYGGAPKATETNYVEFFNPTWSTREGKARIYCVPTSP
jgi:hypothetical protein